MSNFSKAVSICHFLLEKAVVPGDIVVDGTAGNGHDTLFLAQLVGRKGKVYAFDCQEIAIKNTQSRIGEANLENSVQLIHDSHHNLRIYVQENIKAMVFNLGYLPGGDHQIVTSFDTTIKAIEAAMNKLVPGGLIVLVVYPGHHEGGLESEQLLKYAEQLDKSEWNVLYINHYNRKTTAPYILGIEKKRGIINNESKTP